MLACNEVKSVRKKHGTKNPETNETRVRDKAYPNAAGTVANKRMRGKERILPFKFDKRNPTAEEKKKRRK